MPNDHEIDRPSSRGIRRAADGRLQLSHMNLAPFMGLNPRSVPEEREWKYRLFMNAVLKDLHKLDDLIEAFNALGKFAPEKQRRDLLLGIEMYLDDMSVRHEANEKIFGKYCPGYRQVIQQLSSEVNACGGSGLMPEQYQQIARQLVEVDVDVLHKPKVELRTWVGPNERYTDLDKRYSTRRAVTALNALVHEFNQTSDLQQRSILLPGIKKAITRVQQHGSDGLRVVAELVLQVREMEKYAAGGERNASTMAKNLLDDLKRAESSDDESMGETDSNDSPGPRTPL